MKKPDSLRAALTAALDARHHLARNPDRLHLIILEGAASARSGTGIDGAFEYGYTLQVTLLDFAGDPDEVMIPIMQWVARWQPELHANFDKSDQGIKFDCEYLSDDKVDLLIRLPLTERVSWSTDDAGVIAIEHHDDAPVDDWIEPTAAGGPGTGPAPLHAVYGNDDLVGQCDVHPLPDPGG